MPHFRLTCVAQKRLCFNSLLSPTEFTVQYTRKVCSSSGAQILVFGEQIVHTREFRGRLPLFSTKCFFIIIIITPLPFLLCLNSVISLLPRRLCNSRTKVGSCLLFMHSILCTYHCKAGGGGWRKAGHGVGIWHFSKICRQIPCPRANHSSQMQPNFPTPGCTLLSNIPRQNPRKAQWKHLQIRLCNLYL